MELILWRHAEAEAHVAPGDREGDQARNLTAKGARHASRVGAWLDRQLPAHCRIVASPAARCVQTAQALGRKFAAVEALNTDSSAERILDACGWPGQKLPVVVVGHQPLLGQVAALVFSGQAHDWKIRKASVLWIARKDEDDPQPFIRLAVGPDLIGKLR
ncbi:histidine phosphatase family protein [Massilia forsythiae]|uniref:Histidine phosphatase family protein n=1 Tax=Massilia forsythiae TaxID=2728020 RepID=A0A7Z2W0P5_9BURK|nr:histidine phosphatase family protein [Massilia forsythiae]QJE02766.1 histidine phosphatase family protein [Massilia forsythiae]